MTSAGVSLFDVLGSVMAGKTRTFKHFGFKTMDTIVNPLSTR